MPIKRIKILIILGICFMAFSISAQNSFYNEKVIFVADRGACVSGDTVWVKAYIFPGNQLISSNIVHIQLDNLNNNHVTKSIIHCDKTGDELKGSGYIVIPDSLSTGIYSLKAFTNYNKNFSSTEIPEKWIAVYNRFDENFEQIEYPVMDEITRSQLSDGINIILEKQNYQIRERIDFSIEIDEELKNNLKYITVGAGIDDPGITELEEIELFRNLGLGSETLSITENDGFIINGKVLDASGNPSSGVVVYLSIPDTIPYFDYCYSDGTGSFIFYLKNAYGKGNIYLQAFSEDMEYLIEINENYIELPVQVEKRFVELPPEQKEFINNIISAGEITRLYNEGRLLSEEKFNVKPKFNLPFYGKPTNTIILDEYIELPDFVEISRELLQGVRLRERDGEYTIRLLNIEAENFFDTSPLILVDGIPVFNPNILISKGSNDINRIDAVLVESFYGDLKFEGILSLYSNGVAGSLISGSRGITELNAIQVPVNSQSVIKIPPAEKNIPDMRRVLLWNNIEKSELNDKVTFYASDIKGKVLISVTGITSDGKVFKTKKYLNIE